MTPITGLHWTVPNLFRFFSQFLSFLGSKDLFLRCCIYSKFQSVLLKEQKASRFQSPFSFFCAEDSEFKEKDLKWCPRFFPFGINSLMASKPPTALSWWENVSFFPLYYNYISSVHTHRGWNTLSSLLKRACTDLTVLLLSMLFYCMRRMCDCRQDSQRTW